MNDGEVCIYGRELRGDMAIDANGKHNSKLTRGKLLEIATFIDDQHKNGKMVVSRHIRAILYQKCQLDIHRTTTNRAM